MLRAITAPPQQATERQRNNDEPAQLIKDKGKPKGCRVVHKCRDQGAGAVEYLGILLLVSAIAAALFTSGTSDLLVDKCKTALCRAFGGECGEDVLARRGGAEPRITGRPLVDGGDTPLAPDIPPGGPQPPPPLPPIASPRCQLDRTVPWVERLHAHNDYENEHPLDDALDNGATSVEADIWLENGGRLEVKHDDPKGSRADTLLELYLKPLTERIKENGGVYPGYTDPFELIIEAKDKDKSGAYEQVAKDINSLNPPLASNVHVILPMPENYDPDRNTLGDTPMPVNIRFSASLGDQCAIPDWLNPRNKNYDARIANRVVMLNGDFNKCVDRSPKGRYTIDPTEHQYLNNLVTNAHANGRKVRIWNAPDGWERWKGKFYNCIKRPGHQRCEGGLQKNWWQAAEEAGLDYYVTNHLGQTRDWLLKKCGKKTYPPR
ncbi:hypothetical protein [Actinomadura rugatobispora]|uniref:GP-PDE domain-containing protein n=1 Tax=Actinomadura rugatobispora TaxID=1994 RepID=A0ABW0ZQX6_9ACTN|nr:hypothetical protein GCM10010200_096640 [Actinomadura rugatobispora]